jgi:hypothetical protein
MPGSAAKRPDLDSFLAATSGAERRALLIELVNGDLDYKLKAGEPVRVEDYLDRYSELASDQAVVLDLIAREFSLRRRTEPELSTQEYVQRFPPLDTELAGRLGESLASDHSLFSTIRKAKGTPSAEAGQISPFPPGAQPVHRSGTIFTKAATVAYRWRRCRGRRRRTSAYRRRRGRP